MKFNFLNDERINQRFLTLERNIRSESNSFYDSYLDLVESTIRYIIEKENIETNKYSVGEILTDKHISYVLFDRIDFNPDTLIDYVRKCNKHKHKIEKEISFERVLNYLIEYFKLINCYLNHKNLDLILFDVEYFTQIYGQTKRDNINLNKKVLKLIAELKDSYLKNKLNDENIISFKKIIEEKENDLDDLEEKNEVLRRKIDKLKDIKISSMEEKLNRTIELLLELKEDIVINKALSKAVGHSIMGENFDEFINEELGDKNGK